MKPSLEDERRALLEQIEASRAVYRRMLAGETGTARHAQVRQASHTAGTSSRNRALEWAMAHPLWVAGGVALLVLLLPRAIGSGRQAAARRTAARRPSEQVSGGGTLRALLTVAALLLRDPARMRTMTTLAGNAWRWLQGRRRSSRPPLHPAATAAPPETLPY